MMKCINIGCGSRFNENWINVDIQPVNNRIIAHDISNELPFTDNYFDVVYHSHVIEHLQRDKVAVFLEDCYRVLKPGGILRIAAPDLEQITRMYLLSLDNAYEGKAGWDDNYNWMMLELYDQVVRVKSGGEMLKYLHRKSIPNIEFISERCGYEVKSNIDSIQSMKRKNPEANVVRKRIPKSLKARLRKFMNKRIAKDWLVKKILGVDNDMYLDFKDEISFQKSGELHRWMYDKYSLTCLLRDGGFKKIQVFEASESNIQDWNLQNLDCDIDGNAYKPDSIYIESIRNHE